MNGVKTELMLMRANLFVTLHNVLVLLQSLEKVGKRSLRVVQVAGHLLLLLQGLCELPLGLLPLLLLIGWIKKIKEVMRGEFSSTHIATLRCL